MIKGSVLAEAGFPYLGYAYETMDCQGFIEQCLDDCGLEIDLPGSNAWYRKMNWVGTPEECLRRYGFIPPGAFLFILEKDGKEPAKYRSDGIGNASHIGIVTGKGQGAIHSSKSRGGVRESEFHNKAIKNGGWNRVGLWTDQIDYGISEQPQEGQQVGTTAIVRADNGLPVKMRAKPDSSCRNYEEVPCGETVDVIEAGEVWTKIRWAGKEGYMKTVFLTDAESTDGWMATIYGLTQEQAEAIKTLFPQVQIEHCVG